MSEALLNIVAVQLDIAWEQPRENLVRVEALLARADVPPGSLIVLPEMFATGFSMQVERTAQDQSRSTEAYLRHLARKHRSVVLGGVVGPLQGATATNEAVAIDASGQQLVRYCKMQPFTISGEQHRYPAGQRHQLFQWRGVCVAPFICYDLRFPEVFRPAARDGAELFVVIANWPAVRSEHWVRLLQARAIENQAYVVGVNRCGSAPELTYDGRSVAFDPLGVCLIEAGDREQVLAIEIDVPRLRAWREKFPALADMRR